MSVAEVEDEVVFVVLRWKVVWASSIHCTHPNPPKWVQRLVVVVVVLVVRLVSFFCNIRRRGFISMF